MRFRKSRLPMRRGITRIEEAIAIAETLRRERLHGPDDVFVVRESDGARVDGAALAGADTTIDRARIPQRGHPASSPAPPPNGHDAGSPPAAAEAPPPAVSPTTLLRLLAGLERARRTSARAAEAHLRLERCVAALDAALGRSVGAPPPRLVEHQARIHGLRELIAAAAASFAHATQIAEARLHDTWRALRVTGRV